MYVRTHTESAPYTNKKIYIIYIYIRPYRLAYNALCVCNGSYLPSIPSQDSGLHNPGFATYRSLSRHLAAREHVNYIFQNIIDRHPDNLRYYITESTLDIFNHVF
jgi:hypothetical protein